MLFSKGMVTDMASRAKFDRWLSIILTFKCNLSCKYCLYKGEKGAIGFGLVKNLLKEAKQLKYKAVSFSGGEPSTHPNFMEIIEYANGLGFEVEIVTNGTNLRQKDFARLAKIRKLRFVISLDSYDKEKNDELRGNGAYEAALKMWAVTNPYMASFITLVTKENLLDMPRTADFILNKLGAHNLTLYRAVPQGGAVERETLSREDDVNLYTSMVDRLYMVYREQGKQIFFGLGSCNDETCAALDRWVVVYPDGGFGVCCNIPQLNYYKYKKSGDLKNFLENDYRTKLNERIDKATYENRQRSIKRYGIAFCHDCISDLRKEGIIK